MYSFLLNLFVVSLTDYTLAYTLASICDTRFIGFKNLPGPGKNTSALPDLLTEWAKYESGLPAGGALVLTVPEYKELSLSLERYLAWAAADTSPNIDGNVLRGGNERQYFGYRQALEVREIVKSAQRLELRDPLDLEKVYMSDWSYGRLGSIMRIQMEKDLQTTIRGLFKGYMSAEASSLSAAPLESLQEALAIAEKDKRELLSERKELIRTWARTRAEKEAAAKSVYMVRRAFNAIIKNLKGAIREKKATA